MSRVEDLKQAVADLICWVEYDATGDPGDVEEEYWQRTERIAAEAVSLAGQLDRAAEIIELAGLLRRDMSSADRLFAILAAESTTRAADPITPQQEMTLVLLDGCDRRNRGETWADIGDALDPDIDWATWRTRIERFAKKHGIQLKAGKRGRPKFVQSEKSCASDDDLSRQNTGE